MTESKSKSAARKRTTTKDEQDAPEAPATESSEGGNDTPIATSLEAKRVEAAEKEAEAKPKGENGEEPVAGAAPHNDSTRTRGAQEESGDKEPQSEVEDHPQRTADPNPRTGEFNIDSASEHPKIAPEGDVTGGIQGATQSHLPKNAITEQVPEKAATDALEARDTFVPGSYEGAKKDTVPVKGGAELIDQADYEHVSTPAGSIEDGTYRGAALDLHPVQEVEAEEGAAPRAATLQPPQGTVRNEVESRQLPPTTASAVAHGLSGRDSYITIAGSDEEPDADDLFVKREDGVLVSKYRLLEHTAKTKYDPANTSLVLAQGKEVSPATAAAFEAKVKASQS